MEEFLCFTFCQHEAHILYVCFFCAVTNQMENVRFNEGLIENLFLTRLKQTYFETHSFSSLEYAFRYQCFLAEGLISS